MTNARLLKSRLRVGQRVQFSPTHNKFLTMTGQIVKIHEGSTDCVDIKTEAGNGSVSRLETVHAADVQVLEDPVEKKAEKSGNGKGKGAAAGAGQGEGEKPKTTTDTAGEGEQTQS